MSTGTVSMISSANLAKMLYQAKKQGDDTHRVTIDLADIKTCKGSAAASGDTIDILTISAWTKVKSINMIITVPVAGGSVSGATIAVGDQSSGAFIAASDVTTTAGTCYSSHITDTQLGSGSYTVTLVYPPVFYYTANAIQLTLGGTWTGATAGRVELLIETEELGAASY